MTSTELFWKAEDQTIRLEELTSLESDMREAPLRRDVRSLGFLLGEVIREQAGQKTFEAEEELRHLAIRHRKLNNDQGETCLDFPGERELQERAAGIIDRMTVAESYQVVKAFSTYFELTNLAETNHRKRRRRATHACLRLSRQARLTARHPCSACVMPESLRNRPWDGCGR